MGPSHNLSCYRKQELRAFQLRRQNQTSELVASITITHHTQPSTFKIFPEFDRLSLLHWYHTARSPCHFLSQFPQYPVIWSPRLCLYCIHSLFSKSRETLLTRNSPGVPPLPPNAPGLPCVSKASHLPPAPSQPCLLLQAPSSLTVFDASSPLERARRTLPQGFPVPCLECFSPDINKANSLVSFRLLLPCYLSWDVSDHLHKIANPASTGLSQHSLVTLLCFIFFFSCITYSRPSHPIHWGMTQCFAHPVFSVTKTMLVTGTK